VIDIFRLENGHNRLYFESPVNGSGVGLELAELMLEQQEDG